MKTKIVPISYDEDLDRLRSANGGVPFVGIEEMSIMYIQPADCIGCNIISTCDC